MARADEPLFKKGRLVLDVLGADVAVAYAGSYAGYAGPLILESSHVEWQNSNGTTNTSTASAYGLAPSADYFVTDHVTVGGRLEMEWQESHSYQPDGGFGTAHQWAHGLFGAIGPRVGVALPILSTLGFWPRVSGGVSKQYLWTNGAPVDATGAFVEGNFALVARVAPHILLELGPVVTYRSDGGGGYGGTPTSSTQLDVAARSSFRLDF